MSALIAKLKLRLANRPDSEHSQAIVRLGLTALVLCVLLWSNMAGHRPPAYEAVLMIILMGFIVGIGLLAGILARPGVSHVRRAIGMASDYGLMAAAMSIMGEPLAWFYVIIMWVTVGNGLRFGTRYLYGAMALAVLSFSLVLLDRQAAAGAESSATLSWDGDRATVTYPIPDVPGATAVATLDEGYLPERIVVTHGENTTEFVYSDYADWNNPLHRIEALYAGMITERQNGEVVRDVQTIETEIGQVSALAQHGIDVALHGAVDVVGTRAARPRLVVARLEPRLLHVDCLAIDDGRDGVEEGEGVAAGRAEDLQLAARIDELAAVGDGHLFEGKGGGAQGTAHVEDQQAGAGIAAELQCHERQQHAFARARWSSTWKYVMIWSMVSVSAVVASQSTALRILRVSGTRRRMSSKPASYACS